MNNNNTNPINLFFTKHFLSMIGVFYITTLSPFIGNYIDEKVTKKDIGHLVNATLVTMFGASIKAFDSNVYTPKGLPGKDKKDILTGINDPIINTVQAVQSTQATIEKPSIFSVSNALQDINDATNKIESSITTKEVNTIPDLEMPNGISKTRLELITRRETYYKLEPVDSNLLDNNKKVKVAAETSLFIDDYSIDRNTNHLSFNIGERVFYAYLDHIKIIDNEVQLVF